MESEESVPDDEIQSLPSRDNLKIAQGLNDRRNRYAVAVGKTMKEVEKVVGKQVEVSTIK